MKPKLADFTDEQLKLAWNFMRRPAAWPDDIAAALDDDLRLGLFLHFAATFLRERTRHQAPRPVPGPTPAPEAQRATRTKFPPLPRLDYDARSAAANDLND